MSPPRSGRTLACASLLLLAASLARADGGAAAILGAQTAGLVERLRDDKLVLLPRGESDEFIRALVIFQKPPGRVMRLLSQTARHHEFRPELRSIETVERMTDGTIDEQRLKIMFVSLRYQLRNRFDFERRTLHWTLHPEYDNDLKRVEGTWELFQLDEDRTLARFATAVDVGPALPEFLQEMATRKQVPATMENARRWVDSDGQWRP